MYVCGPTVYQRIHIGNARPYIVFLWMKRWLEEQGYDVKLVENITDINDKIYAAAPGDSARLAADAARWYVEDTDLLGLGRLGLAAQQAGLLLLPQPVTLAAEAHRIIGEFIPCYNTAWLIERLGHRTPTQARADALGRAA